MQIKGLVKFFTVVLILISLYQLSFTFVVKHHEKIVAEQATEFIDNHYPSPQQKYPDNKTVQVTYEDTLSQLIAAREKEIEDSTSDQIIYNTLINKYTYLQAKEQELNLGLDLQGGMNVVLQVSLEDLIRSMAGNSKDPAFNKALELASQRKANSSADYISLFYQAWNQVKPANEKLAPLFTNAFQKNINYNSSDAQVISVIRSEAANAIKRTYNVLSERIDKFGVAQPEINYDENKGIISVELAGVHDPDRVGRYLQATAKLEFWETYELNQDFYNSVLVPMNAAIARYLSGGSDTTSTSSEKDTTALAKTKTTGSKTDTSTANLSQFISKNNANPTNQTGNTQETAEEKQNPLFSILHQSTVGRPAIGAINIGDTARFNHYLSLAVVQNVLPSDLKFLYGATEERNPKQLNIYAIKTLPGTDQPELGGEHVVNAAADVDPNGGYEINMTMDNTGARIWKKMTAANVGKCIAIVLDNEVYSAPNVEGEISGGSSSISGRFTAQEAQDLANILQTGKLPAPAHIVQEQVIGPTLGKESIIAGAKSFIIAFLVIFILMLVYFNTGGWVANIALILNLLFTIGVLAALGATLTMPGIAGLVLTIGMAVDTNVIIFERIKEELFKGKSYLQSISDGYKHSYAPILDAHVTTLLTAIILFYFGLGPVKGFATTQILGILLSLFCGILVSRLITDYWTNKKRHFEYFTPLSRKIFRKAHFKFIESRKYAYVISGIVLCFGVASFFHGFRYGVEFKGGRSYDIRFDQPVKTEDVAKSLQPVFHEYPIVKTIGTNSELNITTSYLINQTSKNTDSLVERALYTGLKKYLPAGLSFATFHAKYNIGSQKVLPTISDALKKGAMKAVIFAMAIIFIYILIRFRKWQYSLGTIVALLHDVLVTLAVFSFFRNIVPFSLEINQEFIAAILTVIGYSMNDTVIVFDRIREYFREMKGVDKATVIDKAINDTLSRTVMTSLTVFLTIVILFIFGGQVIRGFAFAMMVGVITGTYSSIFIASPILVDFDKKNELGNLEAGKVKAPAYKSKAPVK
jgi:SecD/SecF fusion protein